MSQSNDALNKTMDQQRSWIEVNGLPQIDYTVRLDKL